MKRFFLITIGLFLIGVGAPLMAASTGAEKNPGEKGSVTANPDSMDHHLQREDQKSVPGHPSLRELPAMPVPSQNRGVAGVGQPKQVPAEAGSPKKEEEATQNLSFNFLYYLFYKFNLNDFSKTPQYH